MLHGMQCGCVVSLQSSRQLSQARQYRNTCAKKALASSGDSCGCEVATVFCYEYMYPYIPICRVLGLAWVPPSHAESGFGLGIGSARDKGRKESLVKARWRQGFLIPFFCACTSLRTLFSYSGFCEIKYHPKS